MALAVLRMFRCCSWILKMSSWLVRSGAFGKAAVVWSCRQMMVVMAPAGA